MWLEDLVAVAAPTARSDRCCACATTPCPRTARRRAAVGTRRGRERGRCSSDVAEPAASSSRIPASFSCLAPSESDPRGEQTRLAPVGDDDLVLARRVPVPARDDAELEQHLLDVLGQLPAAGRIRHLNRVARAGPSRSRRPRRAPAGRPASPRPASAIASPGRTCRADRLADQVGKHDCSAVRVRFWMSSSCSREPRRDRAFVDVPRSADDRVVGRHHHVEVVARRGC